MTRTPGRFDPDRWQVLSPLFDRALDLPPEERAAWLATLRRDDPTLTAELEGLLEQRDAASREGFLAGPPPVDAPPPSLAGQVVGAYTLRSPIGRGGMGTVWLAERSDGRFQGRAAVKLLNLALVSPVGQERFRREGSMLARLTHPGIARLLDAGVSPTGQPFLVLEYVEGQRIDQYAESRRLTVEERVGLLLQVLSAVGHAHANLVVHRDLKPSNILVTDDGTAKLLDFGIGKLLAAEPGEEELTRDERVLTPEYAAPEQIRGEPVTTATDTHAVGLLLYELLTGRRPYDTAGRPPTEVERILCEQEPARPSRITRRVGSDLDAIVMKALRKEPERRYPSAPAMEDDLRRFLEGRPVQARPDAAGYRIRKFVLRHRVGVGVALVLAALLAGGALRERALRARAEAEARKAAAVKDYLVSVFEVSDPFGRPDPHGGDATARELLERGAARLDSSFGDQPDVRTELRGVLGWVYTKLGVYDRSEPLLRQALAEKRARFGDRSLEVAEAATKLADTLGEMDRNDECEALLREALAVQRALLPAVSTATAATLDRLATVRQARSDYDSAESLFRESLAMYRAALGNDDQQVAESLSNLGVLLYLKGRYDDAEPVYREALAIHQRKRSPDHPLTTIVEQNLAQTQMARGQVDEAIALYRRSLVAKRKVLGNAHPNVTVHLNNLGISLATEKGELAEAEALIREALAGDRKTFGESHSYVAESLDNLATVYRLRGDFDEAERIYRQALEMNRTLFGEKHVRIAKNQGNIATTRHARGDLAGAIPLYRESVGLYERLVNATHFRYNLLAANLGRALRENGQLAEAETVLLGVSTRLDPANPGHRATFIRAQIGLGQTLTDLGRASEAAPILERALQMSRERFGPTDWRTGEASLALGACRAASSDFARAEPLLREALDRLAGQKRAQPTLVRSAETQLASVRKALAASSDRPRVTSASQRQ